MENNTLLAIIAVSNAVIAVVGFGTLVLSKFTRDDVKILEKNTNSIREELVAATAKAYESKGRDEQRVIGEEKAMLLAQGRSEGKLDAKTAQSGPVPVTDSRTAKAAEATAASTEKLAEATVKIADATEKKEK